MPFLNRVAAQARRTAVTTTVVAIAVAASLALTGSTVRLAATTANPVTPGSVSGYGFDQCQAPSQAAMTAWHKYSPFRAAGIYLSGSLRYCHDQPNLTPTWVHTQLAAGWRLLPIHLGRQASCTTVARYQTKKINANPADSYAEARAQGVAEAKVAVAAARNVGIPRRSTLFYDLESFDINKSGCRYSALWFLGAWTNQLKASGYASGVYSSAATGIKMLDDARVAPKNPVPLPDFIWIADWNDKRDTASTYIRSDGWPGRRIHQYRGGHDETYGGVTINIDSSVLDLHGFPSCSQANTDRSTYRYTTPDIRRDLVTPLQCQLKKNGYYPHTVTGAWNSATSTAVIAFQNHVSHPTATHFSRADWVALLSAGSSRTTLQRGSKGLDVVRAQRALNAATSKSLTITGVFDDRTYWATISYQTATGIQTTGRIGPTTWRFLTAGRW